MTLRNQGGDWDQRQRVPEEFEAAIKPGKSTEWYDDALYNYAEWMMNQGRVMPLKDGGWHQEPDYVKALELFRRLVREFKKGETPLLANRRSSKSRTSPTRTVQRERRRTFFCRTRKSNISLNWRNVKRIDLALYPVDLTRDVQLAGAGRPRATTGCNPLTSRAARKSNPGRTTPRTRRLQTRQRNPPLDGKLPAGRVCAGSARRGQERARTGAGDRRVGGVEDCPANRRWFIFATRWTVRRWPDANVKLWERYNEDQTLALARRDQARPARTASRFLTCLRAPNNEQIFAGGDAQGPAGVQHRQQLLLRPQRPGRRSGRFTRHRPAGVSPEGNRAMEIHRAAIQRLGLFHAVRIRWSNMKSPIRAARR